MREKLMEVEYLLGEFPKEILLNAKNEILGGLIKDVDL